MQFIYWNISSTILALFNILRWRSKTSNNSSISVYIYIYITRAYGQAEYIGETVNEFRKRITKHKNTIRRRDPLSA